MEGLFSDEELNSIFVDSNSIDYLMQNEKLRNALLEKSKEQRSIIMKYLSGFTHDNNIFIVDIGWKGSIQDNISRIFGPRYFVHGYYYGLKNTTENKWNIKKGLMFDMRKKEYDSFVYSYDYGMLENLFVADHGPVMKYVLEDDIVIPILSDDPDSFAIFKKYKKCIDSFTNAFFEYANKMSRSVLMLGDIEKTVAYAHLWNNCIFRPRQFKQELDIRKITKENFGNISNVSRGTSDVIKKDKKMRKQYLFVAYTYRGLEQYGLNNLYWLVTIYNKFVFRIKYAEFSLKKFKSAKITT